MRRGRSDHTRPPRGGEQGAGASLGPARVTCPKHAHVTRAPPLAPGPCAEETSAAGRIPGASGGCAAACCACTMSTRSPRLPRPSPARFPSQAGSRRAFGCRSIWDSALVPKCPLSQPASLRSSACLHPYIDRFIHSCRPIFQCSQPSRRPGSGPGPRGAKTNTHACLQ